MSNLTVENWVRRMRMSQGDWETPSHGEQRWAEIKEAEERDGKWNGTERLIPLMSLACGECQKLLPVHVRMLMGTGWAAFDGDAIKEHMLEHADEETAAQMAGVMMAYFMDRLQANSETKEAMSRVLLSLHKLSSDKMREITSKVKRHGGLLEWVRDGML